MLRQVPGEVLLSSCSKTEFCWLKDNWKHIEYPHGIGSKPEDPTHAVLDYTMEQVADLLRVGGVIARQGTSTYHKAWGYLQPACVHYLFGLDTTISQKVMAAENVQKYANLVEALAAHGRVRSCTSDCLPLSPVHLIT
jgi:hypothetical protein